MSSKKVINFGPGPAKIPSEVLDRAQRELKNFSGTEIGVLEISHRSPEFLDLMKSTEKLIRDLLHISGEYEVLFLQGGGTGQFAGVPLNLMKLSRGEKPSASYVVTGTWSSKAAKEAEKYLIVHKSINPSLHHYTRIPDEVHWSRDPNGAYMYYCGNETVHGVEFHHIPESENLPLVADISSNALSKPLDISKHGVVFFGTQKNVGAAGLTVVIVRKYLIGHAHQMCPSIINYKEQHAMASIYNTPPVFSIYITKLVLEWIKEKGGVEEMNELSQQKSQMIYDIIDSSGGFYHCPVQTKDRSRMNVPFRIGKAEGNGDLEKSFLSAADKMGMVSLKGHRSVGGIRASLYNAVTVEETQSLADHMKEFMETHRNAEIES